MKSSSTILIKIILTVIILAVIVIVPTSVSQGARQDWPDKFEEDFDKFFGEDWECTSTEVEKSLMAESTYTRSNGSSLRIPRRYRSWTIDDGSEVWELSTHPWVLSKYNNRFKPLTGKRYSKRQALLLEFADIAYISAGDKVKEEVIGSILPGKQKDCFEVEVTYTGGNPRPEYYEELMEQPWFDLEDVTAYNFLKYDEHDYYLLIRAHDYRLDQLSEAEKKVADESIEEIEKKLCKLYGKDADFEIIYDGELISEYSKGRKVKER